MMHLHTIVFDAVGSLLNFHAATARHGTRPGPNLSPLGADRWQKRVSGPGYRHDFSTHNEAEESGTVARRRISDGAVPTDVPVVHFTLDADLEVLAVSRETPAPWTMRAILPNGAPGTLADVSRFTGVDDLPDCYINIDTITISELNPDVYGIVQRPLDLDHLQIALAPHVFRPAQFGFPVFWRAPVSRPPGFDRWRPAVEPGGIAKPPDSQRRRGKE